MLPALVPPPVPVMAMVAAEADVPVERTDAPAERTTPWLPVPAAARARSGDQDRTLHGRDGGFVDGSTPSLVLAPPPPVP